MTQELRQALLAELTAYCRENIEDYDRRVEIATDKAYNHHTGFELEAEWSLLDAMNDAIDEWLANEISLEDIALYSPDNED